MDNQGNRLHLNFGNNNDRLANDRTYPTTPSTFPQPVYQGPPGSAPSAAQQQQQGYFQQGQAYSSAQYYQQPGAQYAGGQYGQPGQAADYSSAGQGYGQSAAGANNDPNTGLARQFSNQNLGGGAPAAGARGSPYLGNWGQGQGQRPRTAGGQGQQPGYGSGYANPPPLPNQGAADGYFAPAPERNPDKYGPTANNNQKKCSQLASDFFKDSVKRARERNQR